jgi:hypothetical protein
MAGLWGDGGPYSQVHVIRELRILDDHPSRTFYYVKANVNPTTYAVLKRRETEIEDEEIRAFLRNATFVSDEEGYEWTVFGQAALSPRGANRASEKAADAIIRMHRLVMDALDIEPPKAAEGLGSLPGEPPAPEADSGPAA